MAQAGTTGSSVYIRWGSASCPESAKLLYSGVVGGGYYGLSGSGANPLCLTKSPKYDERTKTTYSATIYGAEYETHPEHPRNLDPVCAVCETGRLTNIMMPGTYECLDGWNLEYSGHLMADYPTHPRSSEFICVDGAMEADNASDNDNDGYMLYYVVGRCGSLPCPPYQYNKVITCAVCSK